MQELTGSYVWHYVSNENSIVGVEEHHQYLVCFEFEESTGPVWKMKLAYWYNKGAKLKLEGNDGETHKFGIEQDGFYILDDINAAPRCFKLRNVRYWTYIPVPNVNTDDILTVDV